MCGVKLRYSDRNYVELLEESDNRKVLETKLIVLHKRQQVRMER